MLDSILQSYFIERASFYVSRGIAEQGYRGKDEDECESLMDMWLYNIKSMGVRQEVAFMPTTRFSKG